MQGLRTLRATGRFLSLAALAACLTAATALAQTETILYDFTGDSNGASPSGRLLPDGHGNYYGVTSDTSTTYGTVYEMSPASGGGWTLTTIYTFQGGVDGANPDNLAMDINGNILGETNYGGTGKSDYCNGGCGTVFELYPNGVGWEKVTLWNFQASSTKDGAYPVGGIVLDPQGNLYGETLLGGGTCSFSDSGCGTVFELNRNSSGAWVETILRRFQGSSGANPSGGLTFDSVGNLYGATIDGGPSLPDCYFGCGTIFRMSPKSGGGWTSSLLHSFNGANGITPYGGVVPDSKGNLYGTTAGDAAGTGGIIFQLQPSGTAWKEIPLFEFNGTTAGAGPYTPLTFDSHGNLYGTVPDAGAACWCGLVFKLTQVSGKWHESTVYEFQGAPDGAQPAGPVTIDSAGNIVGVTGLGGTANLGAIYEITP